MCFVLSSISVSFRAKFFLKFLTAQRWQSLCACARVRLSMRWKNRFGGWLHWPRSLSLIAASTLTKCAVSEAISHSRRHLWTTQIGLIFYYNCLSVGMTIMESLNSLKKKWKILYHAHDIQRAELSEIDCLGLHKRLKLPLWLVKQTKWVLTTQQQTLSLV